MEHIADSKTPVSFKYYKGRNVSDIKPVSSFVKKSAGEGKRRMEERSKMRRADIMKYSPQSASDTTKKKVATEPTFKTNSLSIANLRNDYQQELIKKRKKEMQK